MDILSTLSPIEQWQTGGFFSQILETDPEETL